MGAHLYCQELSMRCAPPRQEAVSARVVTLAASSGLSLSLTPSCAHRGHF